MTREEIVEKLLGGRIIGSIREVDQHQIMDVMAAMIDGGLTCVEVSMIMPGGLAAISESADKYSGRALIGAASVLNPEMATMALGIGAQFVTCPGQHGNIVRVCHDRDAAAIPGAMTPTEIIEAWHVGADMVRIYPAHHLGPAYIAIWCAYIQPTTSAPPISPICSPIYLSRCPLSPVAASTHLTLPAFSRQASVS